MFVSPTFRRPVCIVLGGIVWVLTAGAVLFSVRTVQARLTRPVHTSWVKVPARAQFRPGDAVFLRTDGGLRRAGEVASREGAEWVQISLDPAVARRWKTDVRVRCWRTPLSAEAALEFLFPPRIRTKAAHCIADDWLSREEELASIWRGLVAELARDYLEAISDDVRAAWRRREAELRAASWPHLEKVVATWPAVQERLDPVLRRHLTPVLGRLMTQALTEAPKLEIAMQVAQGKHSEAYERMLTWLSSYLATMSEADRVQLYDAALRTWDEAREDPVVAQAAATIARDVLDDAELQRLVAEIYREAVAENPRSAEFLRSQVFDSPEIRERFYAFVEALAPTVRNALSMCMFDNRGMTRPEIVHLVRASFLGRRVAWLTIEIPESTEPSGPPPAVLEAEWGDRP